MVGIGGGGRRELTPRPPAGSERRDIAPVWSPDGTRLAFTRIDGADDGLYVVNSDGSGLRRLVPVVGSRSLDPAWSPDGRTLAFDYSATAWPRQYFDLGVRCERGRVPKTGVFTVAADGSSPVRLVKRGADASTAFFGETWSPDGRTLLFDEQRLCRYDLGSYLYRAGGDGTDVRVLAGGRGSKGGMIGRAAWSPDGTRIAYNAHCNGPYVGAVNMCEEFVTNADGGARTLIGGLTIDDTWYDRSDTIASETPLWEPGGQYLLIAVNALGGFAGAGVYAKPAGMRRARLIAKSSLGPEWLTLSGDGSSFAYLDGPPLNLQVRRLDGTRLARWAVPAGWDRRSPPAIWLS